MIKNQFSRDSKVFRSENAQEYCDTSPPSLPLYEHNALFPTDLALLSSSSALPYLTDPSIKFFPEDVDVPIVLLNDTLYVAPPTIVYPMESSSTDPTPLVLPPVQLPSDLPIRRSTQAGLDYESSPVPRLFFQNGSGLLVQEDQIVPHTWDKESWGVS
ncbi:hypothetical protein Acr_24g0010500 [Actinidia rufa]|uniref:Uncharacterized protein n=1 Tax=Actinidia rufa TaxID=165716 RepID=A0A7J0GVI4_9ERIC|nr:hypothetical protein Acr_24g0010500 [Actinidia rufa]